MRLARATGDMQPTRQAGWVRALAIGTSLVASFGFCATAAAQTADQPPAPIRAIGLGDALRFARDHQPEVRAALARIGAARADASVPRSQWLPQIGLTAQIFAATANNTTASYTSSSAVDVPRIGGSKFVASGGSFLPYASTFVGAGLGQEIFDFGRIAAQSAAADALVEIETHRANRGLLDIDLGVREAFYAVRAAHAVVEASEAAYTRAQAHRDLAKAGVDAGLRPPVDLTRAEADLARFDLGRVRARGGLAVSQSVLAAAIGAPDLTLDAADGAPAPEDVPSLREALDLGMRRDPRIREAMARVSAQQARTKAISAEQRPDLSLSATFSGRAGGATSSSGETAPGAGFLPAVPNWDTGLVLSWPIYDGTVRARAEASRRREDVARAEVDVARKDDVAAIEQAYVSFEVARSALLALQRTLDAAAANLAQADARFKSGLGTSVELADAEALRTQGEIDLAVGRFQVARARAALSRAIAEGL
jgi:outer membrane protein TolC